jgi:hypothetical protein
MTRIRTLAVHDVVEHVYPRPPRTDADELAIVVGRAIDGTQAQLSHAARQGRRMSGPALDALTDSLLREGLEEAAIDLDESARIAELARIRRVVQAFRRSELVGLARPRSRLIVINGMVGVYAQPDFWDGRRRFYELKSYRPDPLPPAVALQLRFFQLAFPSLQAVLVGIDRHTEPVTTTASVIPEPAPEEREAALSIAYSLGLEQGREKVLEYIDGPKTHYVTQAPSGPPPLPGANAGSGRTGSASLAGPGAGPQPEASGGRGPVV